MEAGAQVPPAIEQYLVDLMRNAGRLGGSWGRGRAGGRGGGWGAARAASRMATVVIEKRAAVAQADDVVSRCMAAFDRTIPMDADDSAVRFAVPLGRTGLQQVVVDVTVEPGTADGAAVILRAYAKEGWLSRHPARTVAERALAAITPER